MPQIPIVEVGEGNQVKVVEPVMLTGLDENGNIVPVQVESDGSLKLEGGDYSAKADRDLSNITLTPEQLRAKAEAAGLDLSDPETQAALEGVQGRQLSRRIAQPITSAGTYVGTGTTAGTNQKITLGFRPDFVLVKSETARTATWTFGALTWFGKSPKFVGGANLNNAITVESDGFRVGTPVGGTSTATVPLEVNGSNATYHFFAYKDNGADDLRHCNHQGNAVAGRVIRYAEGWPLEFGLWKRDNVNAAVYCQRGFAGRSFGGDVASTIAIQSDGTVVVGNESNVNAWSGTSGESCEFLGVSKYARSIHVLRYTGSASVKTLQLPFDDIDSFMILSGAGGSSAQGCLWVSTLSAGAHLPLSAAVVGSGKITSVTRGRVILEAGAADVNEDGIEYTMVAFRRSRIGNLGNGYQLDRPFLPRRGLRIPAGSYVDCGTSDTLSFPSGAYTLEWFGCHEYTDTTRFSVGSGNDQLLQLPLIFRSNGADGVVGGNNVSWGLMIAPGASDIGVPGVDNVLWPMTGNRFDIQNPLSNVNSRNPTVVGATVSSLQLHHIIWTHDGSGYHRLYIDGVLVRERNVNLAATTSIGNGGFGTGHRTCMFARQRGGESPEHNTFGGTLYFARVYGRELNDSECRQNFNALFNDSDQLPVPGFSEEWTAENVSAGVLGATVNAANNGSIVGDYEVI